MDLEKNLKDELNELSPSLSRLDNKEGFQLPPRYFEKLTEHVMHQVNADTESSTEAQPASWQQSLANFWTTLWQPRLVLGMATVALLILAGTFFFNNQTDNDSMLALSDISDEELSEYLVDHLDGFDQELVNIMGSPTKETLIPSSINDDVLNEYFETVIDESGTNVLNELL